MNSPQNITCKMLGVGLTIVLTSILVFAQQSRAALRGLITDELGGAIVGANVALTDAAGVQKKTTTNGEGVYTLTGLASGKYVLQVTAAGFASSGWAIRRSKRRANFCRWFFRQRFTIEGLNSGDPDQSKSLLSGKRPAIRAYRNSDKARNRQTSRRHFV